MPLREVDPEETCALALVADPLVWITEHLRERVNAFETTATALFLERRQWRIETEQQELTSKNVILAVGAVPKKLDYPQLKEIPLEVALDPEKLAQEPLENATIAVFGSSHSSMIALPHLLRHPVEKVINFYRSPLRYAVYLDDWILFDDSGLKGQAAVWARENIDGVHPDRLERCWVASPDFEEKLAACDRAVYTVGFERRTLPETRQLGQLDYNPNNGILAPGLFGLGIAFPDACDRPLRQRGIPSGLEEIYGSPSFGSALVVAVLHIAKTPTRRTSEGVSAAPAPGHRDVGTPNRTARRCATRPAAYGPGRSRRRRQPRMTAAGNPLRSKRTRTAWGRQR